MLSVEVQRRPASTHEHWRTALGAGRMASDLLAASAMLAWAHRFRHRNLLHLVGDYAAKLIKMLVCKLRWWPA
jgi:hypothetical protein